jgi:regulator of PEP synthase PpsR (kinase-PPPase family)
MEDGRVYLGVFVPRHLRDALKQFCQANSTSMVHVVEALVTQFLERHGLEMKAERHAEEELNS